MKKNLHCLKIFKHAYGRINKSKVLALFLISLGLPAFAQIKKIDPQFEHLLKNAPAAKSKRIITDNEPLTPQKRLVVTSKGAETMYPAIVYTNNPQELKNKGVIVETVSKNFATVLLSADDMQKLYDDKSIIAITAPKIDTISNNSVLDQTGASLLQNGVLNNTKYDGEGILVGIFDTGIDYTHPDFRDPDDPTKSRIVSIWDQSITANIDETPPSGFSKGVEYTRAHIEDEIDGTPANFVRQVDTSGHGTHVAGTAAGNGAGTPDKRHKGFAPKAELVIVKGTNAAGLFPSDNTINSLTYFQKVATALNKPIVVNYSIGGQFSSKDGTEPHEITMDNFTKSGNGRVVVVAGGNDATSKIHKEMALNPDETKSYTLTVPQHTDTTTQAYNILYIYGTNNNKFDISVTGPDGNTFDYDLSEANESSDGYLFNNDNAYVIAETETLPQNGKRQILLQVGRNLGTTETTAGDYIINITNKGTSPSILHAYNRELTTAVRTTLVDADNTYMVSSPGNSTEAITVANYSNKANTYIYDGTSSLSTGGTAGYINSTSNIGPRIDGVLKPEIANGGTIITSSKTKDASASTIDTVYSVKSGTSMASPGVAGAVALLLQAQPNLNAKEVKSLLINNANKDIATTTSPNPTYGYGKLNIYKAVSASTQNAKSEFEKLINQNEYITNANLLNLNVSNRKVGTIFTAKKTGKLGSIAFMPAHLIFDDIPLTIEVRRVKDGVLGDVIFSKVIPSMSKNIKTYGWNYFDLSDSNFQTTYGEEFALVLDASQGPFALRYQTLKADAKKTSFLLDASSQMQYINYDLAISATVYEDVSPVKVLATANRETSLAIANNKNYFVTNWENLGRIEKNEGHTIEGEVKAKVWLTNSTKHVNRVYEYTPVNNPSTSTAKVTLYYSQADFENFNANKAYGLTKNLPADPTDESGKSNLVIYKFNGTSTDNSGNMESYTEGLTTIPLTASNILWNPTYSFWEITFETDSFSGFIAGTEESLTTKDNKAYSLQVYPNPVKEQLNINLPQGESKGQATFYDMTGRAVKTVSLNSTNELNVTSLAKGVYLVEITTSKGVKETKKIVKQ